MSVSEAKVSARKKMKTLVTLQKGVAVRDNVIHIDPTILFVHLILLVQRSEDIVRYFGYELTPHPTSPFKDNFMRHPKKLAFADALKKKAKGKNEN